MIHNVSVERLSDTLHNVYVDGEPLHGVSGLVVEYSPMEIPKAHITMNAVTKVHEGMDVRFTFESESVRECEKFLWLQYQLRQEFRDSWVAAACSAIGDMRRTDATDEDIAEAVIEGLLRR